MLLIQSIETFFKLIFAARSIESRGKIPHGKYVNVWEFRLVVRPKIYINSLEESLRTEPDITIKTLIKIIIIDIL